MAYVRVFGHVREQSPEPLVAYRAGRAGHPRVAGQVAAGEWRAGPRERMRPIDDDVADVGVHIALGQGRWQGNWQPVGVVDEGEVGCTGIDAAESLVGVLLGDMHAQVRAARRQSRNGWREQPADSSREGNHAEYAARRALRD
jgi:hypothetical protein